MYYEVKKMNNSVAKHYDKLNYTLYNKTLDNGLKVIYLKKPGFHKYSCYFGCNIGGKVNKYEVDGKVYEIPLGVAHFLEHQMFEMEDGINASDYLAMYGIENNAYTSYDRTMYLTSGTENFEIALTYLLDFVQKPYFKKENIDIEREIIIQELLMYLDRPINKIKEKVRKNMYGKSSYASDVGGNVEEVRKVDEDVLNQVYNHFYIPENMYLGVIGSFDEKYVFDLIEENQEKKTFVKKNIPNVYLDKGLEEVVKHEDSLHVDIGDDCVFYSLKVDLDKALGETNNNLLTLAMKYELLNEVMFGPSSKNFQYIIDNDLALIGFSSNITIDDDFANISFGGFTHKPKELISFLSEQFNNIEKLEIEEEYIDLLNKASLGASIRDFNFFDTTISNTLEYAMCGINLFDYYDYRIKKDDIYELVKYIDCKSYSYAIGYGKNNK